MILSPSSPQRGRVPLALASLGLGYLVIALLQLLPGPGVLARGFALAVVVGDLSYLQAVAGFALIALALFIVPSSWGRRGIGYVIALAFPFSFEINEILLLSAIPNGPAYNVPSLVALLAVSVAWLVARGLPARSWIALVALIPFYFWVALVPSISSQAGRSISSNSAGELVRELQDFGQGIDSAVFVLLAIAVPTFLIIAVAETLGRKRVSRPSTSVPTTPVETGVDPVSILAVVFAVVAAPVGLVLGVIAERRVAMRRAEGRLYILAILLASLGITLMWMALALLLTWAWGFLR